PRDLNLSLHDALPISGGRTLEPACAKATFGRRDDRDQIGAAWGVSLRTHPSGRAAAEQGLQSLIIKQSMSVTGYARPPSWVIRRSEEHTSELQSRFEL